MKKNLLRYILIFALTLAVCTALLFLSEFVPQKGIDENIANSVGRLIEEGLYPAVLDGNASARLDNFTDSVIIMVCKSSSFEENPLAFLLNPIIEVKNIGEYDPISKLEDYVKDENLKAEGTYVRYWMGFRLFLRPLFALFDYSQIRLIQFGLLMLLVAAAGLSVWKNTNFSTAFLFGMSILLIRPVVISRSFQFSCCVFIMLAAILLLPAMQRRIERTAYFLVIGMLTMFFDFYTAPVLTFGMPMVYCAAIASVRREEFHVSDVFKCFAAWFAGYVGMWIAKLSITTAFTPQNGFENGFSELVYWLKNGNAKAADHVPFMLPFKRIYEVVCPNTAAKLIMAALAAALLLFALWRLRRGKMSMGGLRKNLPLLLIGIFPLLWFAVAARPTANHAFFQYRGIAVLYWAVGAFVSSAQADAFTETE